MYYRQYLIHTRPYMLDMDSDLIKYEPTRLTSHYYMKIIMSCQTLLTSIFIDTADSYYFQEQC